MDTRLIPTTTKAEFAAQIEPLLTLRVERTPAQIIPKREAERTWALTRAEFGFVLDATRLVKHQGNQKLDGEMGRNPAVLIASHTLPSGRVHGTCVNDAACAESCVVSGSFYAGTDLVTRSRAAMLRLLERDQDAYATLLQRDLIALARKAARNDQILALRLNVGSDVAFERWLPASFWDVIGASGHAYDYTKRIDRVGWLVPDIYRTSYSATRSTNLAAVRRLLSRGDTVTVVLPKPYNRHDKSVPGTWNGLPMVSGDLTDDRFLDPSGVIVGLSAKGKLLKQWRRTGVWGPLVSIERN